MPYEWTCPEKAFTIKSKCGKSIEVYHAYKDDMKSNPFYYWYTLDYGEDPDNQFDVRDFMGKEQSPDEVEARGRDQHRNQLQSLLTFGDLSIPDLVSTCDTLEEVLTINKP